MRTIDVLKANPTLSQLTKSIFAVLSAVATVVAFQNCSMSGFETLQEDLPSTFITNCINEDCKGEIGFDSNAETTTPPTVTETPKLPDSQPSPPAVEPPKTCSFAGKTYQNGDSVTAYLFSSVAAGETCYSQLRRCNNGTLSGSYTHLNCEVQALTFTENNSATLIANSTVQGSPLSGAVLQRASDNRASLKLTIPRPTGTNYYRVKTTANGQTTISAMAPIVSNTYALQVSATNATVNVQIQFANASGKEVARWNSPSFLVGEVFLVAGQSNAATHGVSAQKSASSLHKMFDGNSTWSTLRDPMPLASHRQMAAFGSGPAGGSPWPAFADQLGSLLQTPVGIVNFAWGGSSLGEWLHGNSPTYQSTYNSKAPLVDRLIDVARKTNCGFKAVLWHQGESDAIYKVSANTYKSQLTAIRSRFVSQTGCQQPWIIARASYVPAGFNTSFTSMAAIRDAQTELSRQSGFMAGPDTDMMLGPAYRYDELHFSALGLSLHANLWVDRVSALYGMTPKLMETKSIPEVEKVYGMYRTLLFRNDKDIQADHNGVFYHVQSLQLKHKTEVEVHQGFLQSDERFIQDTYQQLKNRRATFSEVLNILNLMNTNQLKNREAAREHIRNL